MSPIQSRVVAWLVVAYELAIAAEFLFGVDPRISAATTLPLLIGFVAVAMYALLAGRDVACNCFGQGDARLGAHTIGRAVLLIGAVVVYVTVARQPFTFEAFANSLMAAVTFAAIGLLAGRWILAGPALARLTALRKGTGSAQTATVIGVSSHG